MRLLYTQIIRPLFIVYPKTLTDPDLESTVLDFVIFFDAKKKHKIKMLRDRSLFIAWGGQRILGGDHLIFRRTEGGVIRN